MELDAWRFNQVVDLLKSKGWVEAFGIISHPSNPIVADSWLDLIIELLA